MLSIYEALGARALAKLVWGGPSFRPHDHPKLNLNNKMKKTTNSFDLYNNLMALYLCDMIKKHK